MKPSIVSKLKNRPLIIRSNYGDDSIALTQWLYESEYSAEASSIQVVYIDTGWAASTWATRIQAGEAHAKGCGFKVTHLKSSITFSDAVLGRGEFPSKKFMWCAGLLKGLPFLDWLESKEVDLNAKAVILLAKRHDATLFHQNLEPWIEHCQYHNDRSVWHAILDIDNTERDALLSRAGFKPLKHRSLECQPCVNSSCNDLNNMSNTDLQKIKKLEADLGQTFDCSNKTDSDNYLDGFYQGCGNHFGCGL